MLDKLEQHTNNLNDMIEIEPDMGQFMYLIDVGKNAEGLPESFKTQENKMHGCQAQVWIQQNKEQEKFYFKGDSDAGIVKGIVTIVTESLSGLTKEQINAVEKKDFDVLKLGGGLTAQRQVGLMAMVDHIKNISK